MASATGSKRAWRAVTAAVLVAAVLVAAVLVAATPARADVPATDKAAAEALFEHGRSLMKDGHFAEACAKLEESQRIDPGIGTMLYLADCFEKNGQTASAWAEFLDAAAAAKAAAEPDRNKKARERAAALEGKLDRLSITLEAGADVAGLVVKRDGAVVSKATFGTPLPLDPGEHTVEASAPGKKPWSTKVRIEPGSFAGVSLVIPALEDAPAPPVEPALPLAPAEPRPPRQEPGKPAPRAEPPQAQPAVREARPVRVAGGALLGVGLGAVAAGGIVGAVALLKNGQASANCHANNYCAPAGADDRNAALSLATGADVALLVGAAALTAGVVILVVTRAPAGTEKRVLALGPTLAGRAGGLSLGGGF